MPPQTIPGFECDGTTLASRLTFHLMMGLTMNIQVAFLGEHGLALVALVRGRFLLLLVIRHHVTEELAVLSEFKFTILTGVNVLFIVEIIAVSSPGSGYPYSRTIPRFFVHHTVQILERFRNVS